DRAVRELNAHKGASLFTIAAHLPPAVQAQAALINEQLGNVGATVWYSDPVTFAPNSAGSLDDLARDIDSGAVDALVIIDANPVNNAPGELQFGKLLPRVRNSIHFGLFRDETAVLSEWHL